MSETENKFTQGTVNIFTRRVYSELGKKLPAVNTQLQPFLPFIVARFRRNKDRRELFAKNLGSFASLLLLCQVYTKSGLKEFFAPLGKVVAA